MSARAPDIAARTDVACSRAVCTRSERASIADRAVLFLMTPETVFHRNRLRLIKGPSAGFKTPVEIGTRIFHLSPSIGLPDCHIGQFTGFVCGGKIRQYCLPSLSNPHAGGNGAARATSIDGGLPAYGADHRVDRLGLTVKSVASADDTGRGRVADPECIQLGIGEWIQKHDIARVIILEQHICADRTERFIDHHFGVDGDERVAASPPPIVISHLAALLQDIVNDMGHLGSSAGQRPGASDRPERPRTVNSASSRRMNSSLTSLPDPAFRTLCVEENNRGSLAPPG